MPTAHASAANSAAGPGLASWYTPGRSDGFGDRLLMFDNTDAVSLELLRFRRELAIAPGFDNILRERVELLGRFNHPAFPHLRAVVYLDDHDLTLVSTHISGQRLTELPGTKLRKGLHPAIVTWIIQELTPALAALHASGPAAAHGALTADRIVFTPDGRLCITEHALGPALQRLGLPPRVLWREFGIVTLADDRGVARVDARTDIVQLGTIALSLLLGRMVTLEDVEQRLPALLDEFSRNAAANPSAFAAPLRVWLEHALQVSPRPYRSAADAQEGLKELPAASKPGLAVHEDDMNDPVESMARANLRPLPSPQPLAVPSRAPEPVPVTVPVVPQAVDEFIAESPAPQPVPTRPRRTASRYPWIVAALAVVALAEGAIIARLATQKAAPAAAEPAVVIESPDPGDTVMVDGKAAGVTPLHLTVGSSTRAIRLVHSAAAAATVAPAVASPGVPAAAGDARAIAAIQQAAARQRSGGVRVSSPIDLKVFEGDRVLGSTSDGPIVATAGTHQFDFVNAALGYRVHQTVTIRAGVLTPLAITPPMGRINVNAQPWAQVFIDGNPVGDTPLANLAVSLGDHQVTFRHPQMGEHRETVTVRADAPARVSTTFQR